MPAGPTDAMVRDPDVPAVDVLMSLDAAEVVQYAVDPYDGEVVQVKPTFVDYDPGRGIHVAYDALVNYPHGEFAEQLVASARADGNVAGTEVVEVLGTDVG